MEGIRPGRSPHMQWCQILWLLSGWQNAGILDVPLAVSKKNNEASFLWVIISTFIDVKFLVEHCDTTWLTGYGNIFPFPLHICILKWSNAEGLGIRLATHSIYILGRRKVDLKITWLVPALNLIPNLFSFVVPSTQWRSSCPYTSSTFQGEDHW